MIDSTVNQDLNFCSLSDKAVVTFLYMYWIVEVENIHGAQYHTGVIRAGCMCEQCMMTSSNHHKFVKGDDVFISLHLLTVLKVVLKKPSYICVAG